MKHLSLQIIIVLLTCYSDVLAQGGVNIVHRIKLAHLDTITTADHVVVQRADKSWALYAMSAHYKTPDLIPPAYVPDIGDHGANYLPVHIYIQNNRVYMDGTLIKTSGNINNGDMIFTLPPELRPAENRVVFGQQRSTPIELYILSTGQVKVLHGSAFSWLSLDGISYYLQ